MQSPPSRAVVLLSISAAALFAVVIVLVMEQFAWRADYIARIEHGVCPTFGDYSRPCTIEDYQTNLSGWWLLPTRWPFTLAYLIYAAAIAWLGVLVGAALDMESIVRPWQTIWLVFVPASFAMPLLYRAIREARQTAVIDPSLMLHYEHLIFYAAPLLLIPAAMLVWCAPDTEVNVGSRNLRRVLVAVGSLYNLWMQIAVFLLTIVGLKDS